MLKKDIKFKDYDGKDAVETHYFNLDEYEIVDYETNFGGGLATFLGVMIDTKDRRQLIELFKDFIRRTWGQRSEDGRRFMKEEDEFKKFTQTRAYNALYMELATDTDAAVAFIIGVLPESMRESISAETIENAKSRVDALSTLPPPPPPAA